MGRQRSDDRRLKGRPGDRVDGRVERHDRKVPVASDRRQELLGPVALQPERYPSLQVRARQQQGPARVFAKARAEDAGGLEALLEQLLERLPRQIGKHLAEAEILAGGDQEAVVVGIDLEAFARKLPVGHRQHQGQGTVDAASPAGMEDPGSASAFDTLVGQLLDQQPVPVRQESGGTALALQKFDQFCGRGGFHGMSIKELRLQIIGAVSRRQRCVGPFQELTDALGQVKAATALLGPPERREGRTLARRRHQYVAVGDLSNPPSLGTQSERVAERTFPDKFFVEFSELG